MDKASRAIRRSGVKLLSMTGGNTDLNVLLSEVRDIKNCAKAFASAQNLASQDMLRWAAHEENRAVQDVVTQIAELNLVWSDVQMRFAGQLKEYRQMFEMILNGQKQVAQAKANFDYCDQKEAKLRKELRKAVKRVSTVEINILESRLTQAVKDKDLACIELNQWTRENEAVKLIRLKEGLSNLSSAYIEMSHKCNTLFTAQREVVFHLPDVHGQELEEVRYTAASTTRRIVQQAKEKVGSYTDNNASMASEPPPPYAPPDPSSRCQSEAGERSRGQSGARRPSTPTYSHPEKACSSGAQGNRNRESTQEVPAYQYKAQVVHTNVVQIKRQEPGQEEVTRETTESPKYLPLDTHSTDGAVSLFEDAAKQSNVLDTGSADSPRTEKVCSEHVHVDSIQSEGTVVQCEAASDADNHITIQDQGSSPEELYPSKGPNFMTFQPAQERPVPVPRRRPSPTEDEYNTAEEDEALQDAGAAGIDGNDIT